MTTPEETALHLVRHGQTDNPEGRVKGMLPGFALSPLGREQVLQAVEHLSTITPAAVFASPLARSVQTAELFLSHFPYAYTQIRFGLREWEYPRWENLPLEVVKERFPVEWETYLTHPTKLVDPRGESVVQMQERMRAQIEEIHHRFWGRTVILCTHGDPILAVRAYYEHLPLDRYKTLECALGSITTLLFRASSEWPTVEYWEPSIGPKQDEQQVSALPYRPDRFAHSIHRHFAS